ncbi:hypothetical protein GQ457_03G017730 [Hibiscus cannabinus]
MQGKSCKENPGYIKRILNLTKEKECELKLLSTEWENNQRNQYQSFIRAPKIEKIVEQKLSFPEPPSTQDLSQVVHGVEISYMEVKEVSSSDAQVFDKLPRRTCNNDVADEITVMSNVVNENGPSKVKATDDSHNQRFNAIDDLLLGIARILNHALFPVSMQLHHVKQTLFLLGFNVIDVALWENCSLKLTGNYTGLQVFLVFNIVGGGISPGLGSTLRKRWRVLTTHASIRFKFFDPGIFFSNVKISNRDMFLFQRISLDQNNIKSAFDTDVKTSQRCQLSTIQSWVGQKERRLEMSVISQLEDDHFYIKVFIAAVEKDFSKEQMTVRFFTENTIIVEESEVPY